MFLERHRAALAEGKAVHLPPDAAGLDLAAAGDGVLAEDLVNLAAGGSARGQGAGMEDPAALDAHCAHVGCSVGIFSGLVGGLVDQVEHGAMGKSTRTSW